MTFFQKLFSNRSEHKKCNAPQFRKLGIEPLESRELLAVSFAEFQAISNQYPDLNLGSTQADFGKYNIIEVTGTDSKPTENLYAFNDKGLRDAITAAGNTPQSDIIVIRTTGIQNKLNLNGTRLSIYVDVATRGEVIIVSYGVGTTPLTIGLGANNIYVDRYASVALAGLKLTEGESQMGGAINNDGGKLVVTHCEITGNSSSWHAGGIYNWGTLTMTNSIIAGNSGANYGGGFYNSGTLSMANCAVFGNSVTSYYGGGIYNDSGMLTVTNCTFAGNWANSGGGIYVAGGGSLVINNSIVAKNNSSDIFRYGGVSGSNNLIGVAAEGSLPALTGDPTNQVGTPSSAVDPMFVNIPAAIGATTTGLSYYAPNWNLRLQNSLVKSPAIDKGNNNNAVNPLAKTVADRLLKVDLAGNARIINGTVDIGAYEAVTPPDLSASNGGSVTPSPIVKGNTFRVTTGTIQNLGGTAANSYIVTFYALTNIPTSREQVTSSEINLGSVSMNNLTANGTTTVPINVIETNSDKLTAGVSYYIAWNITNVSGETVFNNNWAYCPTPVLIVTQLPAPNLTELSAVNPTTLSATWSRVDNAISYRVEYSTNSNFIPLSVVTPNVVQPTSGNTVTTNITGLTPGTPYYVRVIALGNGTVYIDSPPSNVRNAVTPLSKPENFRSTDKTTNSVTLAWNSVPGATSYQIRYRTDHGTWGVPNTYNSSPATVPGLAANTLYVFQVRAMNTNTESEWSDEVRVTTDKIALISIIPNTGTNSPVVGTPITTTLLPNGATADYKWYRGSTVVGTSSSYTPTSDDVEYTLRVEATGTGNYIGEVSSTTGVVKQVITPLPAPTIANVLALDDGEMIVTWSTVANAGSYIIEYATTDTFTNKQTTATTGTWVSLGTLDAGVTYYYRVMAIGTGEYSDSDWSNVVSATRNAVRLPITEIHAARTLLQDGTFTLLSSQSDWDTALTYLWDLNGTGVYDTEGMAVRFSTDLLDTKPGDTHTIWHKVRDESGLESEPVSLDLTIIATAPTYEVSGPGEIFAKTPTYWEFLAVVSRFRPIKDWEIDWGDGTEPTQILGGPRSRVNVTHYFREAGTYPITIKTTDFDGLVTSVTIGPYTVKERATAPEVALSSSRERERPVPESFEPVTTEPVPERPVPMVTEPVAYAPGCCFYTDLVEIMRQRQMLDLDQSGRKAESVSFTEWIWDGELFDDEWLDFSEPETSDFWSEVFENDLLTWKL